MYVQMEDRLPGIGAGVNHQTKTLQPLLRGHFLGRIEEMGMVARLGDLGHAGDFLARHDQDVDRSLGFNIPKRDAVVVFINDITRDLPIDNLRE